MKEAGCHVEYFRRVKVEGIIFPWKLLRYNYRSHRRILVIDGRIGFTGGEGISEAGGGEGGTPGQCGGTNTRKERAAGENFLTGVFGKWGLGTDSFGGGEGGFFPPPAGG